MEKNLAIKKSEGKQKQRIIDILDKLIYELSKLKTISSRDDFDYAKIQLDKIIKTKQEIDEMINASISKAIFYFTRSLFSKDLRRNIGYFQMLLRIQSISRFSTQSALIILEFWSIKEVFSFSKNENLIGIENTLLSILEELKLLIESENEKLAEKLLKTSSTLNASFSNIIDKINLDFEIKIQSDEANKILESKNQIIYKIFTIIHNFELISDEIDKISEQIIYINTGQIFTKSDKII